MRIENTRVQLIEQGITSGGRYKTFRKNSKSVSTEDVDMLNHPDVSNVYCPTTITPTSASEKVTRPGKPESNESVREGHMRLRSSVRKIEQKRSASVDSCVNNSCVFSPASIDISPVSGGQLSMTMDDHLGHQLTSYSMDTDININNDPHGSMISDDSVQITYSDSDEDTYDTDSSCATDYENNVLGECGLSACEYGPSVNADDAQVPSHMFKCTKLDCMWTVCRECYRNGGHKRHRKYMKSIAFSQTEV